MPPSKIPGATLLRRGGTVLAETHTPGTTARTRYQIASVSKQFTAAAVLLLAQRGALALDDPVGHRLGGCPPAWRDITLHHLLSNSSGLGHWDEYPLIDLHRRVEPGELLASFHEVPPLFAPGARFHYSSPGFVLLAHVVAEAAGTAYQKALAEMIFTPLGMADTFAGEPGDRADLAVGRDASGEPVSPYELDVVAMGAGDIWSTTGDLLRWVDALGSGRLLDERRRRLMHTAHTPTGGGPDAAGYGYGLFTGTVGGTPWFHHDGGNAGFRSFLAWVPERDVRIVVLSDSEATGAGDLEPLLATALS